MWCVCNFYSSLGFHKYLSGGRHILGTQRLLKFVSDLELLAFSSTRQKQTFKTRHVSFWL